MTAEQAEHRIYALLQALSWQSLRLRIRRVDPVLEIVQTYDLCLIWFLPGRLLEALNVSSNMRTKN